MGHTYFLICSKLSRHDRRWNYVVLNAHIDTNHGIHWWLGVWYLSPRNVFWLVDLMQYGTTTTADGSFCLYLVSWDERMRQYIPDTWTESCLCIIFLLSLDLNLRNMVYGMVLVVLIGVCLCLCKCVVRFILWILFAHPRRRGIPSGPSWVKGGMSYFGLQALEVCFVL